VGSWATDSSVKHTNEFYFVWKFHVWLMSTPGKCDDDSQCKQDGLQQQQQQQCNEYSQEKK
jgi:hypothetical protein